MEETIRFFINLGQLFEAAEQDVNFENQRAICAVANMFLEKRKITIEELEKAVENQKYREMFDEIDAIVLLLLDIKWKNRTTK